MNHHQSVDYRNIESKENIFIYFFYFKGNPSREKRLLKVFSGSNAVLQEKMLYFTLEIPDVQIVGIWELEHYILVIPEI